MIDKTLWTSPNIAWASGLLEGEGTFSAKGKTLVPLIQINMTDFDMIEKLGLIAGFGSYSNKNNHGRDGRITSTAKQWQGQGEYAFEFELQLLRWMGARKTEQILASWRKRKDYESATSGNHILRIFTYRDGGLLPEAERFFI